MTDVTFGQQVPNLFAVTVSNSAVEDFDNLYAATRMLAELDELIVAHANEDYAPMMRDLVAAAQNGLADAEMAATERRRRASQPVVEFRWKGRLRRR